MALTPTQLGTKSKSVSGTVNILSRPNNIGRVRAGGGASVSLYTIGELVQTPLGLQRITGMSPVTIDLDLGPRGELQSAVAEGSTSAFTITGLDSGVSSIAAGETIFIGPEDSTGSREAITTTASAPVTGGVVTVTPTSAFAYTHPAGEISILQSIPDAFDSEYRDVLSLEMLNENRIAYLIPSIPKQPRYIGRDGQFGTDATKDQESSTNLDLTNKFTRYEKPNRRNETGNTVSGSILETSHPYEFFILQYNGDGTSRPIDTNQDLDPNKLQTLLADKEPAVQLVTLHEAGSTASLAVAPLPPNIVLELEVPSFYEGSGATDRAINFANNEIIKMSRNPAGENPAHGYFPNLTFGMQLTPFVHVGSVTSDDDPVTTSVGYRQLSPTVGPGLAMQFAAGGITNIPPVSPALNPTLYVVSADNRSDRRAIGLELGCGSKLTGTMTFTNGSKTVTGSGTAFTTELSASNTSEKNLIRSGGTAGALTIDTITNNTSLTLDSNYGDDTVTTTGFTTSFSGLSIVHLGWKIIDANFDPSQSEERSTPAAEIMQAGFISPKYYMQHPRGVQKWAARRALDGTKADDTGWLDSTMSPEDSPNPSFAFWIGSGADEGPLPVFRIKNDTGETINDARLRLTGFIYETIPIEEGEVKRMFAKSGGYRAKIMPDAGHATIIEGAPTGPADGWMPRDKTKLTPGEKLKQITIETKAIIEGEQR